MKVCILLLVVAAANFAEGVLPTAPIVAQSLESPMVVLYPGELRLVRMTIVPSEGVKLSNVKGHKTCRCYRIEKWPNELKPGVAVNLEVLVQAPDVPRADVGGFVWLVGLDDEGNQAGVRIKIMASVEEFVQCSEMGEVWDMGTADGKEGASREYRIWRKNHDVRWDGLRVKSESGGDSFHVSVREIQDGDFIATVRFRPSPQTGVFTGSLGLAFLSNGAEIPYRATRGLRIRVPGRYAIFPEALLLVPSADRKTMAARVLVTSRDGEVAPVIADVVGFPNGAVDARVEIRDGRLGINVEHHGHGEGNDREGLLLVSFADGETRRIPWMIMSPERK